MMFTGTTQQQDTRFSDKEKKLMKQMKFGDCLNKRVDMSKVKLAVLRPWICKKITDILHIEDDVVVEFVYNQLEEEKFPCPKKMQINMTGFLNGRNARQFMGELWSLLLSAQESETGIPAEFIQQKKDEILKRDEELKQDHHPRHHGPLRSRSHSRTRSRERDRRFTSDRSSEKMTQREREQRLPASTLNAIEQVRSQLSAKSRSASAEETNLGGTTKAKEVSDVSGNAASVSEPLSSERPSSPPSRVKALEAAAKIRNHSPRRYSHDRSAQRASSRNRSSPQGHRRNSRVRDRRRSCSSRSLRRRSVERRGRHSRSKDRSQRRQPNYVRKSRSSSLQRNRMHSRTINRRSSDKNNYSKSPEKRKTSPKPEPLGSSQRERSLSRNSYKAEVLNGHDKTAITTKNKNITSKENVTLVKGKRNSLCSRSRSAESRLSLERKKENPNRLKTTSPSRSLSRKSREGTYPVRSSRSPSRSSIISNRKQKIRRSTSHNTSLSFSPENNKDDFEIRKNKNSVQRKRHYRSNRDSSTSSAERDVNRRQDPRRGREIFGRRFSPRARSPKNEGAGRIQRSHSRRRSNSLRNRSRSRNRSPIRRSRSPRRFNRRRSPQQYFRGGRGGNNRGRNWRRSPSLNRNRGGVNRFERRYSPQQRRFSRERRQSPIHQNQFRKFSPMRRYSPYQQRRRPNSRDRRPSSPARDLPRSGGTAGGGNFNRWDQFNKPPTQRPKVQQRSSSESSNWEENDENKNLLTMNKANIQGKQKEKASPGKKSVHRYVSSSRESSHQRESDAPGKNLKKKNRNSSTGGSSEEDVKQPLRTNDKRDDVRKENVETVAETQTQSNKQDMTSVAPKRKELARDKFNSSLSRTPSPFLKPYEREKAQRATALAAFQKVQEKKSNLGGAAPVKQSRKESDSSSTDSTGISDESDEDEELVDRTALESNKKFDAQQPKTKYKPFNSGKSDSNDESDDEVRCKKDVAQVQATSTSTSIRKEPNNASESENRRQRNADTINAGVKRKSSVDVHESVESQKKLKSTNNTEAVTTTSTAKKAKHRSEAKMSESNDEYRDNEELIVTKSKSGSSSRRSLSALVLKKRQNSTDSDDERLSKKKRKKAKKSTTKRSHLADNESSSESEEENSSRKKKHKKHKKHSKKNKKHRKHKSKKSKKAESESSSEADGVTGNNRTDKNGKMPISAAMTLGGVNEDLEKQLRERALKSMKKID